MVTYVNVTPNTRLRVVQLNRSESNDYNDNEVTANYKRRYFDTTICVLLYAFYKKVNCSEVNSVVVW